MPGARNLVGNELTVQSKVLSAREKSAYPENGFHIPANSK